MSGSTNGSGMPNRNALYIGVVGLGLLVLYFQVFQGLFADWNSNDNYSHGFFIPFISVFMVWELRHKLSRINPQPSNVGLLLVLLGLAQLVLGYIGSEFFLKRTSLILVLSGIVIFLFGFHYFKVLAVPIFYLLFMIPLPAIIWNKIAFPLQLFSSALAEQVVRLLGLSILRHGNVLYLPTTTLEVVDACSGLRSLMTMFALSAFLAWQAKFSSWKKWLLFMSAIPIAIIANTIRLSATAVMASFYGEKVAQGFLHEFSGFVTFGLGTAMLITLNFLLYRPLRSSAPGTPRKNNAK